MKLKQYGLFVTEAELKGRKELVEKEGFEIFEVRPLTPIEVVRYLGARTFLSPVNFYVIMFNATWIRYKWFIFKNRFTRVF